MRRGARNDQRFTGLTILAATTGLVLFLPPLLTAANTGGTVAGVPAVAAYLFCAWLVVIALVAVLVRRSG
ncbi:hypothetical protein JNUCC0626_15980 [Lentzea sp. JNUCC 0626]|uniref:hypothetical protein n=1 Tax=Lentzea sp. JNUCC 0626 TaxID=3367513 RepID=UPI003747D27D